MPRKKQNRIIIEPDLSLDEERFYKVQVRQIEIDNKSKHIRVLLHHLDKEYMCSREITLPLPARPSNLTGLFFQACKLPVSVKSEIIIEDMVGCIINAKFAKAYNGDDYEAIDFQPISEPEVQERNISNIKSIETE